MKKFLLLCFIVVTIFVSNNFCLAKEGKGQEEKDHICFRVVDKDNDGKVTFQEFAKYFGEDKKKFKVSDLNDDGNLSHDEYHQALGHGAE